MLRMRIVGVIIATVMLYGCSSESSLQRQVDEARADLARCHATVPEMGASSDRCRPQHQKFWGLVTKLQAAQKKN
jgi:outer membrane murein-binding lipoprotein Lpp